MKRRETANIDAWEVIEDGGTYAIVENDNGPGIVYICREIEQGYDDGQEDAEYLLAAAKACQHMEDPERDVQKLMELQKLVKDVRNMQKLYFSTRESRYLSQSKDLERKLDALLQQLP